MIDSHLILCLFGILACFVVNTVAREAIINGKEATANQFPYLVSIWYDTLYHAKGHVCGGGILSDNYVITNAHCVFGNNRQFRYRLGTMYVVAGTNDMKQQALIRHLKKIFISREYKPPTVLAGDIAVLKLNHSLELSKNTHLKTLKLPKGRRVNDDGKVAEIAGWGWSWVKIDSENVTGGRNNTLLQFVKADILKPSQYLEIYPERMVLKKELYARVIQSDDDHTKLISVCVGDDGGPLVYDGTVIGILSVTPKNCSERTAIYTRVSQYLHLIENAMTNIENNYMRTYTIHKS